MYEVSGLSFGGLDEPLRVSIAQEVVLQILPSIGFDSSVDYLSMSLLGRFDVT